MGFIAIHNPKIPKQLEDISWIFGLGFPVYNRISHVQEHIAESMCTVDRYASTIINQYQPSTYIYIYNMYTIYIYIYTHDWTWLNHYLAFNSNHQRVILAGRFDLGEHRAQWKSQSDSVPVSAAILKMRIDVIDFIDMVS